MISLPPFVAHPRRRIRKQQSYNRYARPLAYATNGYPALEEMRAHAAENYEATRWRRVVMRVFGSSNPDIIERLLPLATLNIIRILLLPSTQSSTLPVFAWINTLPAPLDDERVLAGLLSITLLLGLFGILARRHLLRAGALLGQFWFWFTALCAVLRSAPNGPITGLGFALCLGVAWSLFAVLGEMTHKRRPLPHLEPEE